MFHIISKKKLGLLILAFISWVLLTLVYGIYNDLWFNNIFTDSETTAETTTITKYDYTSDKSSEPKIIEITENTKQVGPNSLPFHIAVLSAMVEETIFFIILGIIILVISLRDPKSETIENKLSYIFNDESINAKYYAKKMIERLACFSSKSTIKIRIAEYDEEMNAVKLFSEWEFHLHNMYNNKSYKDDDDFYLTIIGDNVKTPDGIQSEVNNIRIISYQDGKPNIKNVIDKSISIKSNTFKKNIDLEICENGYVIYEVRFWRWASLNQKQNVWLRRYTEKFILSLENNSGYTFEYKFSGNENKIVPIGNNEICRVFEGKSAPEDSYWYELSLDSSTRTSLESDQIRDVSPEQSL